MTDELEIIAISPHTVFVSGKGLTEEDAMNAVDNVLNDLYDTNSLHNVDTAIDTLIGIQRFAGKSLAKILYGTELWWNNNNPVNNFYDYMESRHGLKQVTIDRYVTVWECVTTGMIPEDVAIRPMRELVPIAKTLSHGHSITRRQFDKIVKATSTREIEDILRNIKGKSPRKSSMQIYWNRKGDLEVWKDNKKHFIGFLDKEAYENDEVARKAIDRILDSAGVIRK